MNKKYFMIAGMVVLLIIAGGGGFWGGTIYKTNQITSIQNKFFAQRGGSSGFGQNAQGTPFPRGSFAGGNFAGGGTAGQVKSINGNVLIISTAQNTTTVNLSSSTTIIKSVTGTVSDLQTGMEVRVIGQKDSSGNITATEIQIVNNNRTSASPTGTAP